MIDIDKFTIARTLIDKFAITKNLTTSFFFKRDENDRDSAKRFFSIIVNKMIRKRSKFLRQSSKFQTYQKKNEKSIRKFRFAIFHINEKQN